MIQVVCDNCGVDLTTGAVPNGKRLLLTKEAVPFVGGAVMDVHMINDYDKLPDTMHFCSLACLLKKLKQPRGYIYDDLGLTPLGDTPEAVVVDPKYAGQSSITQLGTLDLGTWNES